MSDEGIGLEAALRRIESGAPGPGDDVFVAKRCRERGSKLAGWCEENAKLRAEIERLRAEPRGWLTADEKNAIEEAVEAFVGQSGGFAHDDDNAAVEKDLAALRSLLARNSPPRVRLPDEPECSTVADYGRAWKDCIEAVRAALAAAGVEVEG